MGRMKTIKLACGLLLMAGLGVSSAVASDNEAEDRRLFEETTWGGVYTCAAIDARLHPETARAQQIVMHAVENSDAIPKAHAQAFRKLASAKVDALVAAGRLANFAEERCPQAKVVYMTTGK